MNIKIGVECGGSAATGLQAAVVTVTREAAPQKPAHTMLLLDCSGSMAPVIHELRVDTIALLSELPPESYVSVIVFSGHSRARLIAGPTKLDKTGKAMVGKSVLEYVRIMDVTVFSEPLELALVAARKLAGEAKHSVVLLTDGCAVPTLWSADKEREKSYALAEKLGRERCALSVIGYGPHYDEVFLRVLIAKNGHAGIMRHVSEFENFHEAARAITKAHAEMDLVPFTLDIRQGGEKVGRIYRALPEVALLSALRIETLGMRSESVFYVECESGCQDFSFTGSEDGKTFSLDIKAEPLSKEKEAEFARVYAAYMVLENKSARAAEVLAAIGDTEAAEKFEESYTEREKRETKDEARRYFVGRKYIGKGLSREDGRFCVLDVIRELIENEGNVVFLGDYKRSGELTADADDRVIHAPGRNLRLLSLQSHEKRHNFSFKALKDVKVRPESGSGAPADMKMWRSYNVILDGNLHIPLLRASLTKESWEKIAPSGVFDSLGPVYSPTAVFEIDLRKLPVIARNWAAPKSMGLVALLREEAVLEEYQTMLNSYIKAQGAKAEHEEESNIYYPKSVKVESATREFYDARHVEWRLIGFKPENRITLDWTPEWALKRVREVRQRLQTVRFLARAIIFACECVDPEKLPWSYPKTTNRGKVPREERECDFEGARLRRVVWTEKVACS